MQTAKQLEVSKFPSNIFDVKKGIRFRRIQNSIKSEMDEREKKNINAFDKMMIALNGGTDVDQDDVMEEEDETKVIADQKKFKLILSITAEESGVTVQQIKDRRRFREQTTPRAVVVFLTRWTTEFPLSRIGRIIVNGIRMDHSTCIHTCEKVVRAIQEDDERIYPLLIKVIRRLKNEGINVNLKKNHPDWFIKLWNKE